MVDIFPSQRTSIELDLNIIISILTYPGKDILRSEISGIQWTLDNGRILMSGSNVESLRKVIRTKDFLLSQ